MVIKLHDLRFSLMFLYFYRHKSSELIVKTSQDHWIVGRSGNGRESYVIVSHKNANLVEVTGNSLSSFFRFLSL